jgi:hypothetical protein
VLEGEESSKEPSIALAKLLATCFIIRGAQLSVVGKIDPKARRERPHHIAQLDWSVHRDIREEREQQTA